MPNWCENVLKITGTKKLVDEFYLSSISSLEQQFVLTLNNLYHIPLEEEENGYRWRVDNWGTKWDIGQIEFISSQETNLAETDQCELLIGFQSAWSPPCNWVRYVAANKFPDLHFQLSYMEEGMGYAGVLEGCGDSLTETNGDICYADSEGREVVWNEDGWIYVDTGMKIENEEFIPKSHNPYSSETFTS